MYPDIMANLKDGQSHKARHLDTSRKILLQEMLNVQYES